LDLNCGAEGVCALTCHNDSASNVCSALIMTCGNDACSAACTGAGNPSGFVYTPNQSCGQSNGC
jgi:hypothetical protein